MPRKPSKEVIEAARKTLNGKDVLTAVIQDMPSFREELLKKGLIKEVADA